ncbi:MAG TPA: hypothetical protein VHI95_01395 [Acidimicrobiales bacterium]|jgi:hypothetical protein|nr:hypothetical protein [Acidimicrobiales bacterium]
MSDEPVETIPKPDELLALHDVTEDLFGILRRWFDVAATVSIDLTDIDSAVTELGDPEMIAALAMRKLQALRLLSTPGVRTTTDVVVAIVNDVDRALLQAPDLRLRRQVAGTDWDAALEQLSSGEHLPDPDDSTARESFDEEVALFRSLHQQLHEAAIAVVEASSGEIRILE